MKIQTNTYCAILGLEYYETIIGEALPSPSIRKELSSTVFPLMRRGITYGSLTVRFHRKLPKDAADGWPVQVPTRIKKEYLKLTFKIDEQKFGEITAVDDRERIAWLIETNIYHLFIVLNLAKPSTFVSTGGLFYSLDRKIKPVSPIYHSISDAVEKSLESSWPKLSLLSIEKTWNWYWQFESDLLSLALSPTGRALNAFSHLFRPDPISETYDAMLWIMIGLEALYCKGKTNQEGQINRKTAMFLGHRPSRSDTEATVKNEFSRIYRYRSDFIHGNLNIQNQYMYDDASEHVEAHQVKYWSTKALVLATFIATFQRLVVENRLSMPAYD